MRSFVTATMIEQRLCSRSRDGQEMLPLLVSRLITASIPRDAIRQFRFPHGDQIYLHGADGVLVVDDSVQHECVPGGISIWEMGTSMDPRGKADLDFKGAERKLADAFPNLRPPVTPDKATLVLVGSKAWESAGWVRDKLADSTWRSIRCPDAVALERWIEECPAVMLWFARECGLPAEGLYDAEQYLRKVGIAVGLPSLPPKLALAGREEQQKKLDGLVLQSNEQITIYGESAEESAAFLAAASLQRPDEYSKKPPLVFADAGADLTALATFKVKLTIVPLNCEASQRVRGVAGQDWRQIVPEAGPPPPQKAGSGTLVLGRCKRPGIEQCLVDELKVPEDRASRIARDSRGSLIALLWLLGSGPTGTLRWATRKDATTHASLMLAGSWMGSNEGDRSVVEKLAQKGYRDIETLLQSSELPDGPWIHRGVEWLCASKEFVWARLAAKVTETMLGEFDTSVLEVVGERDVALDLPFPERGMASLLGKERKHSSSLRRGLAESVARLATCRPDGQGWADRIVSHLLDAGRPAVGRWLSLADVFSEIAEASPTVFLDSLETILKQEDAVALFEDREGAGSMFGPTSAHVYLLWALERLARLRQHLPRALALLARLSEIDPGGGTGNRPLTSLITILLPWSPQHSESTHRAIQALERLYEAFPDVVWRVGVGLLPTSYGVTFPTPTPIYRHYAARAGVTEGEYWEFAEGLIDRMITWAGNDGRRWVDLVEAYPDIRKGYAEAGQSVSEGLARVDTASMTDEDRSLVYGALGRLIGHHEGRADAPSALPRADIERLTTQRVRFQPNDLVLRYRLLFSWRPDVVGAPVRRHADGWEELLNERRENAVREIHGDEGVDGVFRLAESAEAPQTVGQSLAAVTLSKREIADILQRGLASSPDAHANSPTMQVTGSYAWSMYRRSSEEWLNEVLGYEGIDWTANARANLVLSLPANRALVTRMEEWGGEVESLYWKNTTDSHSFGQHWRVALEKLIEFGRPWACIELMSDLVGEGRGAGLSDRLPAELVMQVLELALKTDESCEPYRRQGAMVTYYVENVFVYLDNQEVDRQELAMLEWGWLRVLEHTKRGLKALDDQVTSSPRLFVELLKAVFRAEGVEPGPAAPGGQSRKAMHAYHLLMGIHRVPGSRAVDHGEVVDRAVLRDWVVEARRLAKEAGRLDVCDSQMGQMLSYAPSSPDGSWPCEEVRDVVEELESRKLESGLAIGRYNQRGGVFRGKGGKQERDLALTYRGHADKVRAGWPRTARVLDGIAEVYDDEARRWDQEAEWHDFEHE